MFKKIPLRSKALYNKNKSLSLYKTGNNAWEVHFMLIRLDQTGSSPLNVLKQVKLYVSLCLILVDSLANLQSGVMWRSLLIYIFTSFDVLIVFELRLLEILWHLLLF